MQYNDDGDKRVCTRSKLKEVKLQEVFAEVLAVRLNVPFVATIDRQNYSLEKKISGKYTKHGMTKNRKICGITIFN